MRINIPNQITLGRLVLALVFFGLLSVFRVNDLYTWFLLKIAFWVFLIAVVSDILDGYLARTLKQVTVFGRIVDPVVDKVIVCGAFVFFTSEQFFDYQAGNVTGVQPWMVVLILVRELLVSALRGHSESVGRDFAANWVGKVKMFVQSATAAVILGQLAWFPLSAGMIRFRDACIYVTVIVTALSIVSYVRRSASFLAMSAPRREPGAGPPTGQTP
ncbi:MAG: CDP-diacylglycerol--glycerol-3-phosphate 3-phosphatidyltransferase [Phycisphaerae bacterium]|nr:CDP-diacylglycerol--glycerol-3-phosphate 3-phosphatidyltransferase [Phycisphaerae bacterium]